MAEDLMKVRDPALVLSAGLVIRQGPGAAMFNQTSPELEIAWLDGLPTPSSLTTNVHVRASAARGQAIDVTPAAQVTGGMFTAGVAIEWRIPWIPVVIGPELDLGVPWRTFEDSDGVHRQSTLTLVPGIRTDIRIPIRPNSLFTLRYDARLIPISYEDTWTSVVEHGLSLGMGHTTP
jgi:hypothetical protein